MKLLFCIKAMNNLGGGAERVLADLTGGLIHRGHEVGVLSFDPPGGQSFYSLHPKIMRIEIGIGSTTASARILISLRRMMALRVRVCAYAPNVVIGFMHSMFIPLGLSLLGTSFPMIASEHIVPEHYRSRRIEALLLRLAPYLAKRITCVSEQVLRSYPLSLQRKMVAVANPVSMRAHEQADVLGSQKAYKVLLSVGRLEPQKDLATLIQAFAKIVDRVLDWKLRIVGEGELRKQLESQIYTLGLEDKIELAGVKKDVTREYLSAQLFVSSSRYESFGLTTAEALTHGLPVVGFANCYGINQLIRSGENGILVVDGSNRIDSLAEALEALMLDDDSRISLAQNMNGLPVEYSLENVTKRWEEILEQVTY